jgi:hypothetical protein
MASNAIRSFGGLLGDTWIDPYRPGDGVGQDTQDFGFSTEDDVSRAALEAYTELQAAHYSMSDGGKSCVSLLSRLMETLGFDPIEANDSSAASGARFNISHFDAQGDGVVPLVLVTDGSRIDRRGTDGRAPQTELREFLNRTDRTWGLVTDGSRLRVLRGSSRFGSQRFLDFDLRAMFEAGLIDEFEGFYRLVHRSRFPRSVETQTDCLLEKWFSASEEDAERVRGGLREGVREAVETLGTAFVSDPSNETLRDSIRTGELDPTTLYREILGVIYRVLFLAISESRDLMRVPGRSQSGYMLYREHYGIEYLRGRALNGTAEGDGSDVWLGFVALCQALRSEEGSKAIGVGALGGALFERDSCSDLEVSTCDNKSFLEAVRLTTTFKSRLGGFDRFVNFEAMDVEELGSVYESLLEFRPKIELDTRTFSLESGSARKETGSYYTPESLVNELIRTALDPVLEERLADANDAHAKERAILRMRIIDPSAGSGHFLLAAARRMGARLAEIRSDEVEPSQEETRRATRDVIRKCVFAADRNPLAVDLCKVALWIESQTPGLPLSFIDSHVVTGDSLVGVFNLEVLKSGIPDGAFKPVTADDRTVARAAAQLNKNERRASGVQTRLGDADLGDAELDIAEGFESISDSEAETLEDLRTKRGALRALRDSQHFTILKNACDTWTAAFHTRFDDSVRPITSGDVSLALAGGRGETDTSEFRPLHWPLEFPEAMVDGGFDVVLGNPPWERIKLQEKEFFAGRNAEIENAGTAAQRRRVIAELEYVHPELFDEFNHAKHLSEAQGRFLRSSGRFPLGSKGDINTYAVFAELMDRLIRPGGRAGFIVPSGIATDATTKDLFGHLVSSNRLRSLFDFENRKAIFPSVHRSYKFSLMTLRDPEDDPVPAKFAFFLMGVQDLEDDDKSFELTTEDFRLINPNTLTCPVFRSRRDAEITGRIYSNSEVLDKEDPGSDENSWGVDFSTMFHMSNDSSLFVTRKDLESMNGLRFEGNVAFADRGRFLPLYEGKMIHQFDHRWASYKELGKTVDVSDAERSDISWELTPRYWVKDSDVSTQKQSSLRWHLAFRNIARSTDERTFISSLTPPVAVGDTLSLATLTADPDPRSITSLMALLDSFCFDFISRQKAGGTHLNFFIVRQLPVPAREKLDSLVPWNSDLTLKDWLSQRTLELSYTSGSLRGFARDLGYDGEPFVWDVSRRARLRAEIDAAIFHLYGLDRHDTEYILGTFPIVARKELMEYGEYRTRRMILEKYDEYAQAMNGSDG